MQGVGFPEVKSFISGLRHVYILGNGRRMLNISRRELRLLSNQILGTSVYKMASQIPITIKAPAVAASGAAVRGKKRPGTVNLTVVAAPQSTGASNKKKRPTISSTAQQQVTGLSSFSLLTGSLASFIYFSFSFMASAIHVIYTGNNLCCVGTSSFISFLSLLMQHRKLNRLFCVHCSLIYLI